MCDNAALLLYFVRKAQKYILFNYAISGTASCRTVRISCTGKREFAVCVGRGIELLNCGTPENRKAIFCVFCSFTKLRRYVLFVEVTPEKRKFG